MIANVITPDGRPVAMEQQVGARKVDVTRGSRDGSVSSQWFSRPDDQRFLSLDELAEAVHARKERSTASILPTTDLRVRAQMDDENRLWLEDKAGRQIHPNHWSFGQLCSKVGAPASFMREKLSAPIAGIALQHCLHRLPSENVGILEAGWDDRTELRAITGPDYGRVYDAEVVDVIRKSIDDTWKVPGVIDWGRGTYDPNAPISKQSTTLYASDRDVFVFLCRDQYPIEVGKLADGSPDLMFPGFIVSNSETGSRSLSIETMYLRAVCMNRNLWGCEKKQTLRLRHTSGLPSRFMLEAKPAIEQFTEISASTISRKVAAAKARRVGDDDDDVVDFMQKRLELSKKQAKDVLASVLGEEGHRCRSIWDVVQGVTALARDIPHQDRRIDVERAAGKLMDLVSA